MRSTRWMTLRVTVTILATLWGLAPVRARGDAPTPAARPAMPQMSAAELQAFLSRPLIARLATVRKNGTPQIVPMWFLWQDGVLYMSTRADAAKLKHIRANPHVAVVVDVMEAPLKNQIVTIEGTAELQTTNVKELTGKIYEKYVGAEAAKTHGAQERINTPRTILKITPKKITAVDTTHG
jgi:PPOX class probable F420-dependent enzyme